MSDDRTREQIISDALVSAEAYSSPEMRELYAAHARWLSAQMQKPLFDWRDLFLKATEEEIIDDPERQEC